MFPGVVTRCHLPPSKLRSPGSRSVERNRGTIARASGQTFSYFAMVLANVRYGWIADTYGSVRSAVPSGDQREAIIPFAMA